MKSKLDKLESLMLQLDQSELRSAHELLELITYFGTTNIDDISFNFVEQHSHSNKCKHCGSDDDIIKYGKYKNGM